MQKENKLYLYVFIFAFCCASTFSYAETIVLKSGQKIEGKFLERTDKYIKIEFEGVPLTYFLEEVESISGKQVVAKESNVRPEDEQSKKGFLSEVISKVKTVVSQDNLKKEVLESLKEEFILPDSPEWFLAYYYRTKEAERIVPLLKAIVVEKTAYVSQERNAQLVHFFASVLHEKVELKDAISALKSSYTGREKDFIETIIQETEGFKTAVADSPLGMSRAWAEFQATGNEDIIKRIVAILELPEDESHKGLKRSAQVFLSKNAVKDLDVRDIITKSSIDVEDTVKKKIETIISLIGSFTEMSKTSLERGYNYKKLNRIEDALQEYMDALLYCADYAVVYNNISNIYEEKGAQEKALLYRQASVYLDPEYYTGYYNLGRSYFLNGLYDEAIKYHLKVVEYNPKDAGYNHSLARAYQEKGDTGNAIKYFQKYLEYAPNDKFSGLVRNYLASVNALFEEDEANLAVMLKNRHYERLEQYLENLLKTKAKDQNGYSILYNAYEEIIKPRGTERMSEEILQLLNEWSKQRPSSHFATTCLGRFYKDYAYQARGTGFSETVVKEGAKLFKERLEKASEYLEKGYTLNVDDPFAPSALIVVAKGLSLNRNSMEKQFQRAIKADNTDYIAYHAKLDYLMPKWYGTREEMFAFARESAKNAPAHTLIPKLIIEAHLEMYYWTENEAYFKQPEVWQEVKAAYARILADFPDSSERRNWFAYVAYLAGDYITAHEQFSIIKDNWDQECWGNLRYFEKVKNAVASLAGEKITSGD